MKERKKERKKLKSLSCVRLFGMPWTVAYQAPLSMEFYRQEYWSGLPFPLSGELPDPGIELGSPALQADSFTVGATREALRWVRLGLHPFHAYANFVLASVS